MANDQENEAAIYQDLGLALSILGTVAAGFGSWERFGFAGSLVTVAVILIAIILLNVFKSYIHRILRKMSAWGQVVCKARMCGLAAVALLLLLSATIIWFLDWGQARLWRIDYTIHHRVLNIDNVDFGINGFRHTPSLDLGEQQAREREEMIPWLRWLVLGSERDIKNEPAPGTNEEPMKSKLSLIYVVSEKFDGRYETVRVRLNVAESIEIKEAAAFLVSGIDEKPWWKPIWRQMNHDVSKSNRSITITATNPNKDERLVLLLQMESKPDELPQKDHLIPSNIFEVSK